ncbi:substrate-binding domain-containing protein [Rhizobium leguminosarum bv. viciae]|uniref:substrate-binding domain-containing protein n=1 Tax=Rhizobium leguminosarum TaxID=384 RepID=UPI001441C906|nr:substrate-binding domain-containing protein [Rhizobium leguminosarum bv. viciae]
MQARLESPEIGAKLGTLHQRAKGIGVAIGEDQDMLNWQKQFLFNKVTSRLRKATMPLLAAAMVVIGAPAFAKGLQIGFILPTQQHIRFAFEARLFEETAKANGDEAIVQYSMENTATQKNQVETLIARGVDVIVMSAIDANAAAALVTQAQRDGVKVITYDRGVVGAKPDYHIGRDNYEMGAQQARSALAAVPCGKYAIIRGDRATVAQIDMSRAYDELVKTKQCIKIVHDAYVQGWETAGVQREAEAALQATPDLDVFLIMWDTGAGAVVQVLKSAGLSPDDVWVTGADATTPSLVNIHLGWQDQSTWTAIDQMAVDAANLAHDLGTGAEPRIKGTVVDGVPNVYPKLTSINKDNLCEFITQIAPKGWVKPEDVFGAENNSCR